MALRMSGTLEIVDGRIRCSSCEHDICAADANYKLWVLQDRGPLSELPLGGLTESDVVERLELRRFYCPGCVTQLGVEIAPPEAEPLHDIELSSG